MREAVVADREWAAKSMRHERNFTASSYRMCLQAHGGSILEHEGVFYWYGEKKDGLTYNTTTNG